MSESEIYKNPAGMEFPIETKWWAGLIIAPIMPICMVLATITDPTFKESGWAGLVITIFSVLGVGIVGLSFLRKNVIKRFSIDDPSQSLVFEEFWGKFRMVRRTYKLETIDKFEILYRTVPKGQHSHQRIITVALIFQTTKRKYLTGPLDQGNLLGIVGQLNSLLQDQAGFPSDRFRGVETPNYPKPTPQNLKAQKIFAISAMGIFVALMIVMILLFANME
ncbi:MAG: hypothetical protein ACTSWW_08810 [Promethearchaeota archaeon]